MPDSISLKEFVISVRTRRRYFSQCTPEKTIIAGTFNHFYILNVQNIIILLYIQFSFYLF